MVHVVTNVYIKHYSKSYMIIQFTNKFWFWMTFKGQIKVIEISIGFNS